AELRSIKLGDLSIDAYFHLKTVRYMLTTAEMRLKSPTNSTYFESTSSSPMVLLANSGVNAWRSTNSIEMVNKPSFNFNKGSCRFGDHCKFLHNGVHGNPSLWSSSVPRSTVASSSNLSNTDMQTLQSILAKLKINGSMVKGQNNNNSGVSNSTSPMALYASPHGSGPMYSTFNSPPDFNPVPQAQSVQHTPAQSATYSYYPTQIYTQPNISPPGAGQQVYQPGQTGSGKPDQTGPVYSSQTRPVQLGLFFQPGQTAPLGQLSGQETVLPNAFHASSTIPHAFLTSQYTWHQRLGHPGSEVLCRVLSSNSLSCNKEKPLVLYHACQLGKHVKLSFVSSTTSVQSCFDIVHSDLWTSPIPSLSGFKHYVLFLDHCPNIIPQIDSPFPTVLNDEPNSPGQTSSPTEPLQTTSPSEPITQVSPDLTATSSSALQPNAAQQPASVFVSQIPSAPDTNSNPASVHPMVTRFRVRTNRPTKCLNLHVSSISPLPKSYNDAFNDPNWQNAMFDEYNALIKNDTWTLVPQPTDANIVRCFGILHVLIIHGSHTAYLLLYVDDIVLTASSETLLQQIITSLHQELSMTDPGSLNYFLESNLGDDGDHVYDPTLYWSLASSLQYLTLTRPDISYAVQQVCLYMHDPREPYFSALKRILRYVRGSLDYGLQLFSSSTTSLVAYSDSDWAGCATTRRSTSRYCVFLGNNLLSWSSKLQPTLSRSSAKAEYRGVANDVAETCWL
nr:ribonuclease H-like domain-containing protein [Tanacetum cinerariifolium]